MTRRRIMVGLALLAVVAGLVVAYHLRRAPVLGTVALDQYSSMPVVDARTARAFVGDGSRVRVLDTATGALLRTVPVAPSRAGVDHLAVAVQVGRVVVLGDKLLGVPSLVGYVSVLDAHSGRLLHTAPVSMGNIAWLAVDAQTARAVVVSLPDYMRAGAVPDPVRDPVRVSVLDAASGRLLRTTRLPVSGNPSAPLLDMRTGRVFVLDGAGVAVLDATNGRLLRTVAVPSRAGMSPAVDLAVDEHSGRAFAVDPYDGVVRVLDGWSGQVLRTVRLATDLAGLAIDSRRGHLVVTARGDGDWAVARPGRVVVPDGRTGALLRSIGVGPAPVSVAVDEATDHVVMLTSGGRVPVPDPWSWLPPWLRRRLPFLPPRPSTWRTVPPGVSVLDVTS